MPLPILGLHHVTAVAGDPRADDHFYREVLGLRRVKTTTNFDDPTTYHLYYGDHAGTPGSLWTTFPHPQARAGRPGAGEASSVTFCVPRGSLPFWAARLNDAQVPLLGGGDTFAFEGPDGMSVALVEGDAPDRYSAPAGVDESHAIRCIDHVDLAVTDPAETSRFLTEVFGCEQVDDEWFQFDDGGPTRRLRVRKSTQVPPLLGAGRIHHVAFRVESAEKQQECLDFLPTVGIRPTPVQERHYFQSIYFRIPGGVLFEIATDPPGMAIDEPLDDLGNSLKLPPWNEPHREEIANQLIPLPGLKGVGE